MWTSELLRPLAVLAPLAMLTACRNDMHDQPKYKPLAASEFFIDHRSARPVVAGTVARGHLRIDQARYTGKVNNVDIDYFPIPITRADVARGQERFNIYCSPCHSRVCDGQGLIVKRGLKQPPSYHIPLLKQAPVGHFFDVVTNGFGAMASYASRVAPDDRWRIIAYIRALQYSQEQAVAAIPADQRQYLTEHPTPHPPVPQVTNEPPANPASQPGATSTGAPPSPGTSPAATQPPPSGETPPSATQHRQGERQQEQKPQ